MNRAPKAYRLYGLVVRSALTLPCRAHHDQTGSSHVHLRRAPAAEFAAARGRRAPDRWFFKRRLADGTTYLRWRGLCEFLVSPDGTRIRYHPLASATSESIHVYLLGQVLSFSLVARGIDPLHGSVVDIDGSAVALLGDCGSGKSTLAAALLARGCPIVTDDLVALSSRGRAWAVYPGPPRIKLFPGAARQLGLHGDGRLMNGETSKRVIPLGSRQASQRRVPLRAIYVLSKPDRRQQTSVAPTIERLGGGDAFLEVIRGAFNLLVLDRNRLANQFAFASRLVDNVPIRRLTYPRRYSALPAVCDALLTDLSTIS